MKTLFFLAICAVGLLSSRIDSILLDKAQQRNRVLVEIIGTLKYEDVEQKTALVTIPTTIYTVTSDDIEFRIKFTNNQLDEPFWALQQLARSAHEQKVIVKGRLFKDRKYLTIDRLSKFKVLKDTNLDERD